MIDAVIMILQVGSRPSHERQPAPDLAFLTAKIGATDTIGIRRRLAVHDTGSQPPRRVDHHLSGVRADRIDGKGYPRTLRLHHLLKEKSDGFVISQGPSGGPGDESMRTEKCEKVPHA